MFAGNNRQKDLDQLRQNESLLYASCLLCTVVHRYTGTRLPPTWVCEGQVRRVANGAVVGFMNGSCLDQGGTRQGEEETKSPR